MKKFLQEFKVFITRGNVIDMSVGVIVGGAFTAIVTALSNNILKPVINWILALIFGADSLTGLMTFLKKAYDAEGAIDLTTSIYIDWGTFINAIINFLITAFVLFIIIRTINSLKSGKEGIIGKLAGDLTKDQRKELKANGINLKDKEAVDAYFEKKAQEAEEAKRLEEEKAKAERLANPTTEDLLKEIRDLLKNK